MTFYPSFLGKFFRPNYRKSKPGLENTQRRERKRKNLRFARMSEGSPYPFLIRCQVECLVWQKLHEADCLLLGTDAETEAQKA